MRRATLLFAALACSVFLTSCSDDPTPSANSVANYAATQLAVSPVGKSMVVDGCLVQVHRVTTGSASLITDFTMAVAKCPTATVTSSEYNCGKSCRANNVTVTPTAPVFDTNNEAAAAATRQAKAEKILARANQLNAEMAVLDQELQQLKKGLPQ